MGIRVPNFEIEIQAFEFQFQGLAAQAGLRAELEGRLRERVGNAVELISCGISADLLVHTGPTLVGMAVMGM